MAFNKNLVLIGMMGSGKSTVGGELAKKLKLGFIDTDKEIEKLEKKTIKRIFDINGEDYFRKVEEQTTLRKLKLNSSVISIGGGAFINKNIRQEVIKNHLSFWLNWDIETLLARIKNSKKRPLTIGTSNEALINLAKKRFGFYSKATYEVKCDNLSKNEIVNNIIEIYETS